MAALEAIEQHDQTADVFPTDEKEPYAVFGNMRAVGIEKITKMAEILQEGGHKLGRTAAEINSRFPGRWPVDEEYGEWIKTVKSEQREEAHAALTQILSGDNPKEPSNPTSDT